MLPVLFRDPVDLDRSIRS